MTSVLLTAKLKYGVELFFVPSLRWTAITLTSLARMAQVKKEKKPERLVKEKKPENVREQLEFVVQSLPDIGPRKAIDLLLKFGTIQNIVNAEWRDLATTKGIGKKLAQKLYKLFRTDYRILVQEEGMFLD